MKPRKGFTPVTGNKNWGWARYRETSEEPPFGDFLFLFRNLFMANGVNPVYRGGNDSITKVSQRKKFVIPGNIIASNLCKMVK